MIIQVDNLVVQYDNGGTVIHIPSWEVQKGEQIAISGSSGSGKSTLLNTIAGLLMPTKGTIKVVGQEITKMNEASRDCFRASHIGYIFQNFNLLQGYTALENVLLGMTFSPRKVSQREALKVLDKVGLSHRLHHYPAQLSIGEQQRVAVARAITKQPELILADEPTGSLDPVHTHEIISQLQNISKEYQCTLIMVSHEQDVVSSFEKRINFLELNQAFMEAKIS